MEKSGRGEGHEAVQYIIYYSKKIQYGRIPYEDLACPCSQKPVLLGVSKHDGHRTRLAPNGPYCILDGDPMSLEEAQGKMRKAWLRALFGVLISSDGLPSQSS